MVPLASTVHGHLVGQRSTVEAIARVAEKDARLQAEALRLVGDLADYTAEAVTVLVEAYTETVEGEHAGREIDRRELLEKLISRGVEDHSLIRRAPRLGLEAGRNQAVVIARLVPSDTEEADPLCKHLVAEGIARASGRGASHAFVVVRPDDVVAVLDRGGDCAARAVLERVRGVAHDRHSVDVVAGIGTAFSELNGLRASYDEARRALRHSSPARPIISSTEDITLFDDLAVSSGESVSGLIPSRTRQALQDPTLRSTLHAYVEADLNVAAAAKALILHPNSVRYRLRRIASLTGQDPRRITDLFELSAAARVLDADNHQIKTQAE
jgi:sugar diacid utilization regulator